MTNSILVFEVYAKDGGMTVSSDYAIYLPDHLLRRNWNQNFPTYEEWHNAISKFQAEAIKKIEAKAPELFPSHTKSWTYEVKVKSICPILW